MPASSEQLEEPNYYPDCYDGHELVRDRKRIEQLLSNPDAKYSEEKRHSLTNLFMVLNECEYNGSGDAFRIPEETVIQWLSRDWAGELPPVKALVDAIELYSNLKYDHGYVETIPGGVSDAFASALAGIISGMEAEQYNKDMLYNMFNAAEVFRKPCLTQPTFEALQRGLPEKCRDVDLTRQLINAALRNQSGANLSPLWFYLMGDESPPSSFAPGWLSYLKDIDDIWQDAWTGLVYASSEKNDGQPDFESIIKAVPLLRTHLTKKPPLVSKLLANGLADEFSEAWNVNAQALATAISADTPMPLTKEILTAPPTSCQER